MTGLTRGRAHTPGIPTYIPLPSQLRNKKAIINVQNKDLKCLWWSILAAIHPTENHIDRVSNYQKYENILNMQGISYPVKQTDIARFERNHEVSVNVFGYEGKEVFPIRITPERYDQHVNLLLYSDGDKSHYCCIRDLNRLLNDQKTNTHRHFFCDYCLYGFTKESLL